MTDRKVLQLVPEAFIQGLTLEDFEREWKGGIKVMPSVVIAARLSTEICARDRTPAQITEILTQAIEQMRREYRVENEVSLRFCAQCQALTTWRVEPRDAIGLVLCCLGCGKLEV